ncbi:FkbM family methyltransferase [Dyadobacter alkalitolerans]|uniref:FkbM family methyltransferase n=1 Tax=Dyadobacter alkalitolerans TaxID=492736 RepID=UPI000411D90C|nr:FkbM family methyltransferase [Dyadobacter alkalitolerans]
MRVFLRKMAQKLGYDIMRLPTDPVIRQQIDLLGKYRINVIFDIGANTGQYGQRLRAMGYKGKIISFEPLPEAYGQINEVSASDSAWTVVNCAMGRYVGETEINVSGNSYSSSILEVLPAHLESAPQSAFLYKITVPVQTIDSVIDQYYVENSRLFVKIDTQGFEKQVFAGGMQSLDKISGFQMELSLVPLYEGETLFYEMVDLLREYGFKLMLVEGGHRNYDTGEILQVEGYFYREYAQK